MRWPVGVGGKGNDGVAAFVKQTKNSIGYVEFAYARRSQLAYALVQNKAGQYVVPGAKTFAAAAANADWGSAQDFHVVLTNSGSEDAYPIAATSFALMFASPRVAVTDESSRGVLSLVAAARPGPGDRPGLRPSSAGGGVPGRSVLAQAVCRRSVIGDHCGFN